MMYTSQSILRRPLQCPSPPLPRKRTCTHSCASQVPRARHKPIESLCPRPIALHQAAQWRTHTPSM